MSCQGKNQRPLVWMGALLIGLGFVSAAEAVTYTKLSFNADASWDRVRIFLDTKSSPNYKDVKYLQNPARVQIELEGRLSGIDEGTIPCSDSFLRHIRIEQVSTNRIRLTALLAAPTSSAHVDFYRTTTVKFLHIDIERPARFQQPKWTPSEVVSAHSKKVPVVIIDPGHGGYDPGAKARVDKSIVEKEVVLDVALEVREILKRNGKVYPVLTRSGDTYPTLEERVDLIGTTSADLFVSIHADSAASRSASGFAAWLLESSRSSVSAEAQRVLRYGWKSQLARYPLSQQNIEIRRQVDFVEREKQIVAETLLSSMVRAVNRSAPNFENRGVKHDNFKVLRQYYAPSVLLELGFLSNSSDAKLLAKDWFRKQIAQGIAAGIESYFDSRKLGRRAAPPISPSPTIDRSRVVPVKYEVYEGDTIEHIVKRGDTLVRLADRYKVEVADILKASGLPSKRRTIYAGDRLRIPVARPQTAAVSEAVAVDDVPRPPGFPTEPVVQQAVRRVDSKTYQVGPQDNLVTIAYRHGATISEIRALNQWGDDYTPPEGEVIHVPDRGIEVVVKSEDIGNLTLEGLDRLWSEAAQAQAPVAVVAEEKGPSAVASLDEVYRVRPGDTLSGIARKFQIDIEELRRANNLRSDLIRVGQELKLPNGGVAMILQPTSFRYSGQDDIPVHSSLAALRLEVAVAQPVHPREYARVEEDPLLALLQA